MKQKSEIQQQNSIGRLLLAWLVLLVSIPLLAIMIIAWSRFLNWILSLVKPRLSGFFAELFDESMHESTLINVVGLLIIGFCSYGLSELSLKIHNSRYGLRFLIAAVLDLGFAGCCGLWAIRESLPVSLPIQLDSGSIMSGVLSLLTYFLFLVRNAFALWRQSRQPPPNCVVFCQAQSVNGEKGLDPAKPVSMRVFPICYVIGYPKLVDRSSDSKAAAKKGMLPNIDRFMKLWESVSREERFNEQPDLESVYVFDGCFFTESADGRKKRNSLLWKIYCSDLIEVFPNSEKYYYVDMLDTPEYGNRGMGFSLTDSFDGKDVYAWTSIAGTRRYLLNEEGKIVPAASEKAPKRGLKAGKTETEPAAAPAAPGKHDAPAKTAPKPVTPAAKAAPTPVATARKAMTESERKALIQSIYGRDYGAIWAAIDKLKLPIQNICDIEDGKLSDEALRALEDALRQTPKQEAKKTSTQTTKQTPTPTPKQTPKQTSTPKELLADGEKRIYIVMDSSLTEAERNAVARAVEDTRQVFPSCSLELTGQGKSAAAEGIRKNMDTYLEGTRQENGRCNADQILRRLESLAQYKKEAAAILLLTGQDLCLNSQGASWCFGAGNRARHTAVCSLYRYQELTAPERLRCVRRTLRHEIGHALGLAMDPKRTNTEKHFGVHCTAPGCSMRQTENLLKLLRFSREEEQQGKWFCPDCLADLKKALSKAGKRE